MSHLTIISARKVPNTLRNNASKKGGKKHTELSKILFIIDTVLMKDNLSVFKILNGQRTKTNTKTVCKLACIIYTSHLFFFFS